MMATQAAPGNLGGGVIDILLAKTRAKTTAAVDTAAADTDAFKRAVDASYAVDPLSLTLNLTIKIPESLPADYRPGRHVVAACIYLALHGFCLAVLQPEPSGTRDPYVGFMSGAQERIRGIFKKKTAGVLVLPSRPAQNNSALDPLRAPTHVIVNLEGPVFKGDAATTNEPAAPQLSDRSEVTDTRFTVQ